VIYGTCLSYSISAVVVSIYEEQHFVVPRFVVGRFVLFSLMVSLSPRSVSSWIRSSGSQVQLECSSTPGR
jgi:hypothetical protein